MAAPHNTLAGDLPATLAGKTISIHRHRSLDSLFPPASFLAAGESGLADQVQLFAGGSWKIYWLYDVNDADPLTARWVDSADSGLVNSGSTVIPPGHGLFFNNRAGSHSVFSYGEVRANDFMRPLAVANSLVGGGFPINQSAAGTGGRAMTLGVNFFGSRDFKAADSFFVWNTDANPSNPPTATNYSSYFLAYDPVVVSPPRAEFLHWLKVGDSTAAFQESELLLLRDRSVFVRSRNGLDTYRMPLPWAP